MTEVTDQTTTDESWDETKWAEKIAKMLALAENASTQEEAEAFTQRAQEMLTKHAITESLLLAARGLGKQEEIIKDYINYEGSYRIVQWQLGNYIATANNCKVLISKMNYMKPPTWRLTIIGFESDVANVLTLNASLLIQLNSALTAWWRDYSYKHPSLDHLTAMQKVHKKRSFIEGFASGVGIKLKNAAAAGVSAAEKATGSSSGSGELVLVDRRRQVANWMDTTYGRKLKSVSMTYKSDNGYDARNAGYVAGSTANTSQTGLGRAARGELG